jgi:DNA (cytosine-5)-methyltransferase 1
LNVLDLFSGIGGFSLGLERAGMRTVAFCEVEPYPRAVLAERWPGVPIYNDVRELTADRLAADGIAADVICGGFPCQDISIAWNGPGIAGERSGLWSEFARLIGELRPRYAIVENVPALLARGLERVLGDLASLGYDAEWHCIPASAVGAPHERDRIWIVAYPDLRQRQRPLRPVQARRDAIGGSGEDVAHADSDRRDEMEQPEHGRQAGEGPILAALYAGCPGGWSGWEAEPDVGRVADGVPARVDRIKGLGNAVVPKIPELIGRAIMNAESLCR